MPRGDEYGREGRIPIARRAADGAQENVRGIDGPMIPGVAEYNTGSSLVVNKDTEWSMYTSNDIQTFYQDPVLKPLQHETSNALRKA